MRKLIVVAVLLLTASIAQVQAQTDNARDRIEAQKVAYITDQIGLSAEQSQAFWPVYNEYQDALEAVRRNYRSGKGVAQMSDAELEQQLLDNFTMEEELIGVKRAYFQKLKGVITIRQIALLNRAEREFNKEVLKRLLELRQRNQQGRRLDRQPGND